MRKGLLAVLLLASATPGGFAADRPLVGAIRWDAWHGDASWVGLSVERALGPLHWHHRLPFFGRVVDDWTVGLPGHTQEVMDREIQHARRAGIDFWDFVTYAPDDAMSLGLDLYRSSARRADVHFCVNLSSSGMLYDGVAGWPAAVERYARLFQEPGYQMVLGDRPLVFVLQADSLVGAGRFPTEADARAAFDLLSGAALAAGLGRPYYVSQSFDPAQAKSQVDAMGFDAIGAYAVAGSMSSSPYGDLAAHAQQWWETARLTGAAVLPLATAGWDRRPRIENPHSWEPYQEPGVGMDQHYRSPTPQALRDHVQSALAWVTAHPGAAPANAVLIYAWNEIDEGGWLVPTFSEGTARIEALGELLRGTPAPDPYPEPLPVTDGLLLHLDADATHPAQPEPVAQWTDRTGLGHHATASGTGRPSHVPRAMNGRPVIRFDGDDRLAVGDLRPGLGPLHAFVVSQRLAGQLDTGDDYQRLLSTYDQNGSGYDWQVPNWVVTSAYATSAYTYVGTQYPEGRSRGYPADIRQKRDASGTLKIAGLIIGADSASGGSRLRGDIAEVVLYGRALSAAEQAAIEAHLTAKWLVEPSEPSDLAPKAPANLVVVVK